MVNVQSNVQSPSFLKKEVYVIIFNIILTKETTKSSVKPQGHYSPFPETHM